jgi:6-pyruvoyltetrahydropterin/6-carboxytetrahydropterin synthase
VNGTLLHVAAAPFEAAVSVPVLPQGHRSRHLHGHSFLAAVRSRDGAALGERLREALVPLDYGYLNERITVPTDENIARWIRAALAEPAIETVSVQSTRHQGVDMDAQRPRAPVAALSLRGGAPAAAWPRHPSADACTGTDSR